MRVVLGMAATVATNGRSARKGGGIAGLEAEAFRPFGLMQRPIPNTRAVFDASACVRGDKQKI